MAQLSTKLPWELAQTKWPAQLNPILGNPLLQGNLITDVVLAATTPKSINHLLGRTPQGWFLVDNNASCNVWRTQPFNATNITLEASAATTISLWVF